jgi:hypothetical protein
MLKAFFAVTALSGVAFGLSSSACQRQPESKPPQGAEDSTAAGDGASKPEDPGATAAPAPAVNMTFEEATVPVGSWGVSIYVPPGARSEHEVEAERHSVHISDRVVVKLVKVHLPAPASLAEAAKGWNTEKETRNLGEGTTPSGAFYGIRTFKARVGVSAMEGQQKPTWEPVSRVYAVLGVDPEIRVLCTGYVEHGAESAADPDIQAVSKVCLSMRKTTASK